MGRSSALSDRLASFAQDDGGRCAVASREGGLSYGELALRVRDEAERLAELGVTGRSAKSESGASVVGISCADDVPHLVLCLALAELGATSLTVPSYESEEQRRRMLQRVGAEWVVGGDGTALRVGEAEGGAVDSLLLNGDAGPALLFSTSGTTGEPKIVCHSDAGLVAQAHRHVGPSERFACLASMEHNFAKRHRLYALAQGATNVFMDGDPATLVEQCLGLETTTLHVSAFQAQELAGVPGVEALRGLRLKLGGSHVSAALREVLRSEITENLQCGYGTTETGAIAFTDPADPPSVESVGQALEGMQVRIVDAERRAVEQGECGEVAIRCEGMFLGYLGQLDLTAQRLEDGWFYTGDVGRLDAQHRLHLGGRSDDMFVFNSINIHPQEIEAQILEHPSVVDAVVLPQSSPVHGDIPVALVVVGDGGALDLRELKGFVRERAGVRCPRRFTLVDGIPRNGAGKVLRDEARGLLDRERAR